MCAIASHSRTLDVSGVGMVLADLPSLESGRIDPRTWFEHPNRPFEIEIGCGKGTFLMQQAMLARDVNFVGFEWAGEYFRFAADRIRRRELRNVRIVHADATEFIHWRCADSVARVIHLYFSDPWPKKRHHKRRVVQDRTLAEFHRVLAPGGELRIVTDHEDLWVWCEDHAQRSAHLFDRRPFETLPSAGAGEIVGSNFERKYRRDGRPFHSMTLVRRSVERSRLRPD